MARKKVLIIDDEKDLSNALKLNLELTEKYEVHCESDSSRALQTAREFQPDILLLDIVMPGLDGGDVANQLRDDPDLKSIPVVWMTALLSEDTSAGQVVRNEDGQQMLAKPASLDQVCSCIEQNLA